MRTLIFSFLLLSGAVQAAKTLDIYFIDVEGGQSTLIVSPSGQTLLIDTGYAGFSGRDANRIADAAKAAHVKKIDNLLITHFHQDHVGGVSNLLERLNVSAFYDHGPSVEDGKYPEHWTAAFAKGTHMVVKPGDTIPVKGLDVTVVESAQKPIDKKGEANPFCAGLKPRSGETGENPQAAGVIVQFGKFRFADLGDILWNEQLALLCPENKLGKLDVYLSPHHGTHVPPISDYGLSPRVSIINNGAKKGGTAEAWKVMHNSPGLEDLWQLHYGLAAGKEGNSADTFIANIDDPCEGKYLKVSAQADGSFTVYNSRNKYTKNYPAK